MFLVELLLNSEDSLNSLFEETLFILLLLLYCVKISSIFFKSFLRVYIHNFSTKLMSGKSSLFSKIFPFLFILSI